MQFLYTKCAIFVYQVCNFCIPTVQFLYTSVQFLYTKMVRRSRKLNLGRHTLFIIFFSDFYIFFQGRIFFVFAFKKKIWAQKKNIKPSLAFFPSLCLRAPGLARGARQRARAPNFLWGIHTARQRARAPNFVCGEYTQRGIPRQSAQFCVGNTHSAPFRARAPNFVWGIHTARHSARQSAQLQLSI